AVAKRPTEKFPPALAPEEGPAVASSLPSGEKAKTRARASTWRGWRSLPVAGSSREIALSPWTASTLSSGEKSMDPQVQKRPSISRSSLPVAGFHSRMLPAHVASILPSCENAVASQDESP